MTEPILMRNRPTAFAASYAMRWRCNMAGADVWIDCPTCDLSIGFAGQFSDEEFVKMIHDAGWKFIPNKYIVCPNCQANGTGMEDPTKLKLTDGEQEEIVAYIKSLSGGPAVDRNKLPKWLVDLLQRAEIAEGEEAKWKKLRFDDLDMYNKSISKAEAETERLHTIIERAHILASARYAKLEHAHEQLGRITEALFNGLK